MTTNVVNLPIVSRRVSLRTAYAASIREANNSLSRIDRHSTLTMVGYLAAAVVAFKVAGDEVAATWCQSAAQAINDDWHAFNERLHRLHDLLSCADPREARFPSTARLGLAYFKDEFHD